LVGSLLDSKLSRVELKPTTTAATSLNLMILLSAAKQPFQDPNKLKHYSLSLPPAQHLYARSVYVFASQTSYQDCSQPFTVLAAFRSPRKGFFYVNFSY